MTMGAILLIFPSSSVCMRELVELQADAWSSGSSVLSCISTGYVRSMVKSAV